MFSYKVSKAATPAKAGIYKQLIFLDSRFHGNDNNGCFLTFHEFIKISAYLNFLSKFIWAQCMGAPVICQAYRRRVAI